MKGSVMGENSVNRADIGDYIEPGYVGHDIFMSKDAYSSALDSLVFACVDIFMIYDHKVVIAKRTRHPQADWWIFGGRMKTGELIGQSAQRLVKIEAGVDIDPQRFQYLTTFVAAWTMRAHEPHSNGSHNVSITVTIDLNHEEFHRLLLNDEYSEMKLIEVLDLTSKAYHPALNQCAYAYLKDHV